MLWIDAHLEFQNPTAKHLLYALPHLKAQGWTVRAWCCRSDALPGQVEHVFLPAPKWLGKVEGPVFGLLANLYGLWRRLRGRGAPAAVIHATCGNYLGADLVSVHFFNRLWAKQQFALGRKDWKEMVKFAVVATGVLMEWLQLHSPFTRQALCVSDSIAAEVRRRCKRSLRVGVLPNSYDETRFNPDVRALHRADARSELGFPEEAVVFCFASMGHYERKGFWLAVEALAILRSQGGARARLLVIGGYPATLERLQARLDREQPGWREWIVFTGMQAVVERSYAAADAFLFPSYFEAFCLAEIEAAALGLPLFLTPHYGSEMILRDGVNGSFVEFDPAKIAEKLRPFLDGKMAFQRDIGQALDRAEYAKRLERFYSERLAL